jgi:hypothetical protein
VAVVLAAVAASLSGVAMTAAIVPQASAGPVAADLNWVMAEALPNLVVATLGSSDGAVQVFNAAGSVDVIVDLTGGYASVQS